MNVLSSRIATIQKSLKKTTEFKQIIPIFQNISPLNENEFKKINNEVTFKTKEIFKKTIFFDNDLLNISVIFWKPYAMSYIHNHPMYGCYFFPLYNGLIEHKYKKMDKYIINIDSVRVKKDNVVYIDDSIGFHSIENETPFIVPSFHCYSPSKFSVTYYDNNDILY